jgi:hypothetical protein
MRCRLAAALVLALLLVGAPARAQVVNVKGSVQTLTLAAWNSGTALNATQTIFAPGDSGYGEVLVYLTQTTTLTAGAITYEVSFDNATWVTIPADAVLDPTSTTYAQIALPYTVQASTNKPFLLIGKGWQGLRIKLSTQITGTGAVTPNVTFLPYVTVDSIVALSPTAANFQTTTNVGQINGVTPLMGAGATGTGALRVNDVASSATGAAIPASATYVGGLGSGNTGGNLVGATACDSNKVISITSATTTLMVTGVASRQVHICAMHVVTAIANNVALVEGTGATCGTGTAGMAGGSTAANGWNFAANGGIALGAGFGDIMTTATAGDSVCIITSAAGPLAGFIKYAIY